MSNLIKRSRRKSPLKNKKSRKTPLKNKKGRKSPIKSKKRGKSRRKVLDGNSDFDEDLEYIDNEVSLSEAAGYFEGTSESVNNLKNALLELRSARYELVEKIPDRDYHGNIHNFIYRSLFPYPVDLIKDESDDMNEIKIYLESRSGGDSNIGLYHWNKDYKEDIYEDNDLGR